MSRRCPAVAGARSVDPVLARIVQGLAAQPEAAGAIANGHAFAEIDRLAIGGRLDS